jgi:carboxymethylenebutenolidase
MRRSLLLLGTILLIAGCASGRRATPGDAAHVDAMAHEHAGQAPTPNGSVAPPRQPVSGADVTYANVGGHAVVGYLAEPARAAAVRGPIPGIILIHEWWGLNDNIRMMARRYAGEGYRVLAVDLYGGHVASTAEQARGLMMGVMQDRASGIENLRQAADFLRGAQHASRVGVVGYCFGGGFSLQSALQLGERIDAAAVYYGQPVTDEAQLQRLHAPLIGFFGLRDQGIPPDTVRKMEGELKQLGKNVEFHYYDANHAFANPSGPSYNADAAEDAWHRTIEFFASRLRR